MFVEGRIAQTLWIAHPLHVVLCTLREGAWKDIGRLAYPFVVDVFDYNVVVIQRWKISLVGLPHSCLHQVVLFVRLLLVDKLRVDPLSAWRSPWRHGLVHFLFVFVSLNFLKFLFSYRDLGLPTPHWGCLDRRFDFNCRSRYLLNTWFCSRDCCLDRLHDQRNCLFFLCLRG